MDLTKIIQEGDPKEMVKSARELASELSRKNPKEEKDASKTQVRRLFGAFRQIQMTWQTDPTRAHRELLLFGPRLEYQRSRHRGLEPLTKALTEGIPLVGDDQQRLRNLADFFEATVAYFMAE
jgi:CRISPR type III-A-associated protein Csm2